MSLDQMPRTTPPNLPSVVGRSFDAMLRFSYRKALSVVTTFCADHELPLSVAALPSDPAGGNMLSFDTALMRSIFNAAAARAQGPDLWRTPSREPAPGPLSFIWRAFRPPRA
jgi:hypothetical protein